MLTEFARSFFPLLNNLVLLLAAIYLIGRLGVRYPVLQGNPRVRAPLAVVIYGALAVLSMASPILVTGEVLVDFRNVVTAAAGLIEGPLVGIGVGLIGAIMGLLRQEPGALPAAAAIVFAGAVAGAAAPRFTQERERRVWLLLGLGLLVGVGRLAGAALFQPAPEALAVLRQAALPWLLIHPAGILLLGWLLAESQQEIYARRRIDTVNELTTSATAQLDLPQVLDIALDRTLKIMGVQMGWIRVLSEERGGFVLEIQQGLSPRYVREREVVSFEGNAVVAEAAREMRPIAIPDIATDPRVSEAIRAEEVVFLAVVPLSARGKLVGVMTLAGRARRQLLPEEEELLMTIANVIGVALENARLYGELERMATTDELTGLYNRREIERLLAEEVNRALRFRLPLSVIMADLDHFKRVNDTYGHRAGDRALQHVAALLKTRFRGIDLPGRYGGEELLLVLPGTDKGAAIGVAEKLRQLLETTPFQVDGRELRVTLSAGVATLPADARMGDRLIQRADQALYEAKQTGRNRVCAA